MTADKTTPVLKAQNLGIQFNGLKAVDDFSIEIGESELVGLIGPNGAGKTTVFNLITGVYRPTEGSFYLCGQRMNGKKTHQIVHAGIARTFQNIRLFKKMSVIENVKAAMLDQLTYGMNPTETEELLKIIDCIRTRFGISVLLIEHDMSLVMKICQRIQVLDFGTTIAAGTPQQIANDPRVIEAYLGRQAKEAQDHA